MENQKKTLTDKELNTVTGGIEWYQEPTNIDEWLTLHGFEHFGHDHEEEGLAAYQEACRKFFLKTIGWDCDAYTGTPRQKIALLARLKATFGEDLATMPMSFADLEAWILG